MAAVVAERQARRKDTTRFVTDNICFGLLRQAARVRKAQPEERANTLLPAHQLIWKQLAGP